MSKQELATKTSGVPIRSMDDLARVAEMMARSGFFNDAREAAQAGVKIMAGQAWGIDPFNAMTGIHIINNKPSISAGLMAAAVKGHEHYDYRVRQRDAEACRIEFFEDGESLGVSEYTMEMARRAELTSNPTWKRHPEAMLFARCMSQGVRTFTPDVFTSTVYTPDELGAEVSEDGEVLDVQGHAEPTPGPAPAEAPAPAPEAASEAPAKREKVLGPAKAADLGKALDARGVEKPLEFARLATGRGDDLATLADLTIPESRAVFTMADGGDPEEDAA